MTELNLDSMPAVTKAPAKPKPEPAAPRQALRDTPERSIRDVPRAPDGLRRQRTGDISPFYLPEQVVQRYIEAGWSLEWKTFTVFGEQNWSYQNALSENGWEPVVTDEIPGYMPKDYTGAIIRDGMMLMKRPAYLTEEAREEQNRIAVEQVRSQEAKLADAPAGTLTRSHPKLANGVGRNFEPMTVPED